jgi:lipopolysaccharide/colanic/teichoic acid biosynthesis glycosyltransferase
MSLVGPRPPLPREVEQYDAHQRRRLQVKPGMTGLWQVSGRSDLHFDEMVMMDVYYASNWSLALDAKILLKTVVAVLRGHGAY